MRKISTYLTLIICLAAIVVSQGSVAFWPSPMPGRVVSINLCTDELALQLALPGQLIAVTHLVKDKVLSSQWKAAKSFKSHNNSLEQIISYQPELILASQYSSKALLQRLKSLNYRVYQVPTANTLAQLNANITSVGSLLGNHYRAQQIVATQKRKIKSLYQSVRGKKEPLDIVVYLPGGRSNASNDLTSQLIKMAGMRNMAHDKGYPGRHTLSIEQLIRWNPDLLIIIQSYAGLHSRATALLKHPALQYFSRQQRVISIPNRWTSCGTASTFKILKHLISARNKYINSRK